MVDSQSFTKMKNIVIALFLIPALSVSQIIQFEKTFNISTNIGSKVYLNNSGYTITGVNNNTPFLLRLNAVGDTVWSKFYSGINTITDIEPYINGHNILFGTYSDIQESSYFFAEADSLGNIVSINKY